MSNSFAYLTAGALVLLTSATPALADVVIPEPATMSLFAAGAAAAVLINRFRRRK